MVRQLADLGSDLRELVPKAVADALAKKVKNA